MNAKVKLSLIAVKGLLILVLCSAYCAAGKTKIYSPYIEECGRSLAYDHELFEKLKQRIPRLTKGKIEDLTKKIESGISLTIPERLDIALMELARYPLPAKNGSEMFRRIAAVLKKVETRYLPEEVLSLWQAETRHRYGRAALVRQAFACYQFADPESQYVPRCFAKAFAKLLKPPARRYRKKSYFLGVEVIAQLNHLTLIHTQTGALEIQEISPALGPSPRVMAIRAGYLKSLNRNRSLVILQLPGRDGRSLWEAADTANSLVD